ncbi:hypothetical protein E4U41_007159 [Claviceps citrina]|nr:hypothetical protein E4U41_007159 [Claviceps citrina]
MMTDPYYIVGPENNTKYEVPSLLVYKSHLGLLLSRESWCFVAVIASIVAMFSLNDLVQYYVSKILFPSTAFLWKYPSHFGNFSDVLDRGIAGWWGAWWHQTFRLQFLAPSAYLLKRGYLKRGTTTANMFGLFISFLQSGLLHAAGSCTVIPHSRPLRQLSFFLLQGLGVVVQQLLALAVRQYVVKVPRAMRRCGNLGFCLLWLLFTAPLFLDDLASGGVWLFEPVPFSVFRWLGLGRNLSLGPADDRWWRWDKETWLKLYESKHWWEVGFAL